MMTNTPLSHHEFIAAELQGILWKDYPGIEVSAKPCMDEPARLEIYFVEPKFALLYPWQRRHYLMHLIPKDFNERHLQDTYWFELAPGELPSDLEWPDEELINEITPDVMKCVDGSGFIQGLDEAFCPTDPSLSPAKCHGDFRLAKELLPKFRFTPDEFSDVLHVLMAQGGYCDCEILYNIADESRFREKYWKARAHALDHGQESQAD